MGYKKIPNLYKDQTILCLKQVYALEKIHGTSTHLHWNNQLHFFSGGVSQEDFEAIFDKQDLVKTFEKLGYPKVTIYGEGYGGKCQAMQDTYGKELKFIAFEVKIGPHWLSVPDAHDVCNQFGLSFVNYNLIPSEIEAINAERDKPSDIALKLALGEKPREGVVLRPYPEEFTRNNGKRLVAKHKAEEFQERQHQPKADVDPKRLKILSETEEIAKEWVTEMRLAHVLDGMGNPGIEKTGDIIRKMTEDIKIEAEGEIEIEDEQEFHKAVGRRTAKLFKRRLKQQLKE